MPLNYDQYLFLNLVEESIEVAKEASKVIRFTPHDRNSLERYTNLERLIIELSHLDFIRDHLIQRGYALQTAEVAYQEKRRSFEKYFEYSKNLSVVE